MAETLNTTLTAQVKGTAQNVLSLATATAPINITYNQSLTSAAVSKLYSTTVSVSGGATISLNSGTIMDIFGTALNYTKVMNIYVANNDPSNNIVVGGGTSPVPFVSGSIVVGPGGCCFLVNTSGYTVASGQFNINFTSASGNASTSIAVVGN